MVQEAAQLTRATPSSASSGCRRRCGPAPAAAAGTQQELVPEALRRGNAYLWAGVDRVYPLVVATAGDPAATTALAVATSGDVRQQKRVSGAVQRPQQVASALEVGCS